MNFKTYTDGVIESFDKKFVDMRSENGPEIYEARDIRGIHAFLLASLNKCREVVLSDVGELVKSNSKGSFTDDGGHDCWYIDSLLSHLTKLKEELK